jgi:hypothetical protein
VHFKQRLLRRRLGPPRCGLRTKWEANPGLRRPSLRSRRSTLGWVRDCRVASSSVGDVLGLATCSPLWKPERGGSVLDLARVFIRVATRIGNPGVNSEQISRASRLTQLVSMIGRQYWLDFHIVVPQFMRRFACFASLVEGTYDSLTLAIDRQRPNRP